MDELEGRIRSWVDSVASADGRQTTADDAIERAEQTGRRADGRSRGLAATLVAAAVVVVVGGLVALGPWTDGDRSLDVAAGPDATSPRSSTSNGDPRLLGVAEGDGTRITPLIATSESELAEMWTSSGLAGDPPMVDFDRHVVMVLVTPHNRCEIEAVVDWLEVDPQIASRNADGIRFCPANPVDPDEPVVRPVTLIVVVDRG